MYDHKKQSTIHSLEEEEFKTRIKLIQPKNTTSSFVVGRQKKLATF